MEISGWGYQDMGYQDKGYQDKGYRVKGYWVKGQRDIGLRDIREPGEGIRHLSSPANYVPCTHSSRDPTSPDTALGALQDS